MRDIRNRPPQDDVIRSAEQLSELTGLPVFTGDKEGIQELTEALLEMKTTKRNPIKRALDEIRRRPSGE